MDITNEEKQRKEFCDILRSLAYSEYLLKEKSERSKMYQRLENLYYSPQKETQFRHYYSDIFVVLSQIQQDKALGTIDVLGENLRQIRKGYQSVNKDENENTIDISDSIKKLYDHVNLEIARLNYSIGTNINFWGQDKVRTFEIQQRQIEDKLHKSQKAQKNIEKEQKNIERAQKNIEKKLDRTQKDYIAILGIFAAIVITFVGGIAFSTSVLDNIHKSSIYRIIIVSLMIGIVLINILYGLFYYIDRLVNSTKHRTIKPLVISNFILIFLLIIISIMWLNGVVEKRNENISKIYYKSSNSVVSSTTVSDTIITTKTKNDN